MESAAVAVETPHRTRNRALSLPLLAAVLLLIGIGGTLGARYLLVQRWKWAPIVMPQRIARVSAAWTPQVLAERLHQTHKVRDAATFVEAARRVQLQRVAPGAYILPAKAGPAELAQIFKQPPALLKVTFPEGWTAHQMARRLAASGFANATDFERLAYPSSGAVSPWEGRLFPDTYYLPRLGTGQQLLQRLAARYRATVATLPHPFPRLDGRPMTLQQVTTLASLVERETDVPEERPLVAGVLLNRLQTHMRLQCDATVQYALERAAVAGTPGAAGHKTRLLFRDLKIQSPYNTYRNAGLPPGPICNPGADSLRAAARPHASKYLFYVMSPKLGHHRFATTFAEHQHNIRLAHLELH